MNVKAPDSQHPVLATGSCIVSAAQKGANTLTCGYSQNGKR